jgi:plasmid stabilization system protein ParE
MARFRLTPAADRDIQAIWDYIARDSSDAADRVLMEPYDTLVWLTKYPQAGHTRHDISNRSFLFWTVGNYQVIYRRSPEEIEILAVLHASRDIPAALRDREPDE